MLRGVTVLTVCTLVFAACSAEPRAVRSAGEPCGEPTECESNLCHSSTCLENAEDDDLDGLVNSLEISLGLDPTNADMDGDGRSDGLEVGGDLPSLADEDGDGKPDVLESADPTADSDNDCIPDQKDPDDENPEPDLWKAATLACCCYGMCTEKQLEAFETVQCHEVDGIKQISCLPTEPDTDGDGWGDSCDSCPLDKANDSDGDGLCDSDDNCPYNANEDQADEDGDGGGDVCDPCPGEGDDVDGDDYCTVDDICPEHYNPEQDRSDKDKDGVPDTCDQCFQQHD
ncbi:MAG: thrombospondin type 3 repeat-containing protein, partial [Myxococcota bacterium]|nr:thrombospondin type 3 repeat-containing protein [Myxococcota bacterium]